MIIISPYVKPHVEHTQYETTSVLKFIEKNWNLARSDKKTSARPASATHSTLISRRVGSR